MGISIRNKKAEQLAREVAELRHITMTEAIIESLEEEKKRLEKRGGEKKARLLSINEIGRRCAALEDLDTRSPEEILEYGEEGAP